MARVLLSLGSNVEPRRHLDAALAELSAAFGRIVVSPTYRAAAVGFEGPDFLNLVVALDTSLEPEALDAWLHALEARHGRRRDVPRFSSRTLDVDIVLYDDCVLAGSNHLEIPRRELLEHAFVLKPASDVAPDVTHPLTGKTLAEHWRAFDGDRSLKREPDHE